MNKCCLLLSTFTHHFGHFCTPSLAVGSNPLPQDYDNSENNDVLPWPVRTQQIAKCIHEMDPEIVVLHKVWQSTSSTGSMYDNLKELLPGYIFSSWHPHAQFWNNEQEKAHAIEGEAIFSKVPLVVPVETRNLSEFQHHGDGSGGSGDHLHNVRKHNHALRLAIPAHAMSSKGFADLSWPSSAASECFINVFAAQLGTELGEQEANFRETVAWANVIERNSSAQGLGHLVLGSFTEYDQSSKEAFENATGYSDVTPNVKCISQCENVRNDVRSSDTGLHDRMWVPLAFKDNTVECALFGNTTESDHRGMHCKIIVMSASQMCSAKEAITSASAPTTSSNVFETNASAPTMEATFQVTPVTACCSADSAFCMACKSGVTKWDYCQTNPTANGCKARSVTTAPEPVVPGCCKAMSLNCMACKVGKEANDFCNDYPGFSGCNTRAALMTTIAATAVVGETDGYFFAADSNVADFDSSSPASSDVAGCCDAMNAVCIACNLGQDLIDFCHQNVGYIGCQEELFRAADSDGDGKITLAEFSKIIDRSMGQRAGGVASLDSKLGDDVETTVHASHEVFDTVDANHDGAIDLDEINGYNVSTVITTPGTANEETPTHQKGSSNFKATFLSSTAAFFLCMLLIAVVTKRRQNRKHNRQYRKLRTGLLEDSDERYDSMPRHTSMSSNIKSIIF
jgi:hypothetical protein